MAKAKEVEGQRLVTPEFRVSYPHLFKPSAFQGQKPKYSVTMLFKKEQDLTDIKKALQAAKVSKWGPDKAAWPKNIVSPVQDGDASENADKAGYAGHWVIKASTNEESKPGLVDQKVQPIIDQSGFYAGCYARAQIFAFPWEFAGKNGVSFILDHVQKTRDGEPFGSKRSAAAAFGPVASADFGGGVAGSDDDF